MTQKAWKLHSKLFVLIGKAMTFRISKFKVGIYNNNVILI